MEDKMTMAGSLRWMRDKFGAWAANTTAFTFMWLSVGFAVGVLFIWDGVWATHQAPLGMELSYRAAGWALRIWVVFSLVGVVALYRRQAWITASFLLITWLLASVMTYGHAVGFMATGQMQRYAKAQVVTDVETVTVDSVEEQNTALESQIDGIRQDRDDDVKALETALNSELNDGNSRNDDAAREKYTALITERRAKAQTDIDALRAEVRDNLTKKQDAKTTAKENSAEVVAFDPLYIWIAHLLHGQSATDDQIRSIAAAVGAFWAFLVELLAGAGPAILYAAHAHFAQRSDMPENSETVAVDKARLEELEQREKAAKEGGKKAARTRRRGTKIEQAQKYAEDRIDRVQAMFFDNKNVSEIAEALKLTPNQLKYELEGYVNKGWMAHDSFVAIYGVAPNPSPVRPESDDSINGYAVVLRQNSAPVDSTQENEPDSDNQDEDEAPPVAAE